jgi:glycosyltransferase involved in cell wall biosynthesis
MKMLYVANLYDPLDHNAGSGTDYDLTQAFLASGATLEILGPFVDKPSFLERFYHSQLHPLFSKRAGVKYSSAFIRATGKKVNEAIKRIHPDVICGYFGAPLVHVKPVVPIVYIIDTTLKGSQDQRHFFSQVEYLRMLSWERKVIRKSAHVITWSQWSAQILHDYYKVPLDRISFFPRPTALPSGYVPAEIRTAPADFSTLKLLLVGREYERKGVDIALQLVELLNQSGVNALLHIVGLNGEDTAHVRFFGVYRKTDPAEMETYVGHYRWAHFLVHPARFEAAGIVPAEAAAFGVPTITNAAGGLATTVQDGVSGVVLPFNSPAEEYRKAIRYFLEHPEAYNRLRISTRERYDRELNWDVAGKRIYAVVQKTVEEGRH